jgi:two-component system NtrC family sensor kinase
MLAPSYQSSILCYSTGSQSLTDLGSEFVADNESCLAALAEHPFKALVVERTLFSNFENLQTFLRNVQSSRSQAQVILLGTQFSTQESILLFNEGLVQFVTSPSKTELESCIPKAISAFNRRQQDASFFQLFDEQNERLADLKTKLEARVEKRQKFLNSARAKLSRTDKNVSILHKCFVAIHKSQSFQEIESNLLHILQSDLQIQAIEISTNTQQSESSASSPEQRVISYTLVAEEREFGKVDFFRDIRQPFSTQEEDLLDQTSDAISLAATRILVLGELESLTNQWETTFNTISDPLCLTDESFAILKGNTALGKMMHTHVDQLNGKDPFEALGISQLKKKLKLATGFRERVETEVREQHLVFDVIAQRLSQSPQTPVNIVIFRDITQAALLEKQALESSKLAELGIIGSSIAHELNNPIGGILNFLQLIKMDINEDESYYEDIDEMERAAQRCKQIIESLLGFARKDDAEATHLFTLGYALDKAIKICEIQTKSKGIQVIWKTEDFEIEITGHQNQWIQVLRNLLQNSIDAIDRKAAKGNNFTGQIEITIATKGDKHQLQITDNGDGIEEQDMPKILNPLFSRKEGPNSTGLGLTVAFRILNEHGANLFFQSVPTSGTTAIISLKSPEIQGSSQVFDTKI